MYKSYLLHYFKLSFQKQIDGGSENANKAVLAFFALLVARRVVRHIELCRLPTGHTHENIDACFGVIWTHMRLKQFHTNDEYIEGLLEAFAMSKFAIEIVPVYCIPDYKSWISQKGVMDESVENFARLLLFFYRSYCCYNIPK